MEDGFSTLQGTLTGSGKCITSFERVGVKIDYGKSFKVKKHITLGTRMGCVKRHSSQFTDVRHHEKVERALLEGKLPDEQKRKNIGK